MRKILSILVFVLLDLTICFGQTTKQSTPRKTLTTGYVYVLSSDNYIPVKYSRTFSKIGDDFVTKYTVYHPSKGYAWRTITATHYKSDKKVKVSVDDINESIFSHINDEETTYSDASLDSFGLRGGVGALGGKRVPNQLMVRFANVKYENVILAHVLGSEKSDFNSQAYFILDEKKQQ